jgi:hypothetical protein
MGGGAAAGASGGAGTFGASTGMGTGGASGTSATSPAVPIDQLGLSKMSQTVQRLRLIDPFGAGVEANIDWLSQSYKGSTVSSILLGPFRFPDTGPSDYYFFPGDLLDTRMNIDLINVVVDWDISAVGDLMGSYAPAKFGPRFQFLNYSELLTVDRTPFGTTTVETRTGSANVGMYGLGVFAKMNLGGFAGPGSPLYGMAPSVKVAGSLGHGKKGRCRSWEVVFSAKVTGAVLGTSYLPNLGILAEVGYAQWLFQQTEDQTAPIATAGGTIQSGMNTSLLMDAIIARAYLIF